MSVLTPGLQADGGAGGGCFPAAVEEGSTHGVGFRIGAGLSGASEGL